MFYRSKKHRVIAGVCGGIANRLNVRPLGVRIAFAILALFYGITILTYIVMWLVFKSK